VSWQFREALVRLKWDWKLSIHGCLCQGLIEKSRRGKKVWQVLPPVPFWTWMMAMQFIDLISIASLFPGAIVVLLGAVCGGRDCRFRRQPP